VHVAPAAQPGKKTNVSPTFVGAIPGPLLVAGLYLQSVHVWICSRNCASTGTRTSKKNSPLASVTRWNMPELVLPNCTMCPASGGLAASAPAKTLTLTTACGSCALPSP